MLSTTPLNVMASAILSSGNLPIYFILQFDSTCNCEKDYTLLDMPSVQDLDFGYTT